MYVVRQELLQVNYIRSTTTFFNKSTAGNYINMGKYQIRVNDSEFEDLLDIAIFAESGKSHDELIAYATSNGIAEETLLLAINNKIIIAEYSWPNNGAHFKNKHFLDLFFDPKNPYDFSNHHVVVVGCGGMGNFMSYPLSTLGIGTLTLVDADTVERSNLNRQFLFNDDSIGLFKVDEIERKVQPLNRKMKINKYAENISLDLLNKIMVTYPVKPTLIVLSADDEYCMPVVNDFCTKQSVPYLNMGYLNDYSVIGPFYIPEVSSCAYCQNSLGIEKETTSNEKFEDKIKSVNKKYVSPAFFTNNAFASGMALVDILYFFNQQFDKINSLNKRVGINNHDFTLHSIAMNKNSQCDCNVKGGHKNDN